MTKKHDPSRLPRKLTKRQLANGAIVVICVAIGFGGGVAYQRHEDSNKPARVVEFPRICNCPNIPVNANISDRCNC